MVFSNVNPNSRNFSLLQQISSFVLIRFSFFKTSSSQFLLELDLSAKLVNHLHSSILPPISILTLLKIHYNIYIIKNINKTH